MHVDRLEQNLRDVRRRIRAACDRAGRDPSQVTLVAVTKTVTSEVARALAGLGVADLGENRIQDAARKREDLADLAGLRWHMIGHLQTNKAKDALRLFHLIHSVDTARVAEALDRRASADGNSVPVLLQVNVSGEGSKSGVAAPLAIDELRRFVDCPLIEVKGLMTMAPFVDDPELVRPVFSRLRHLAAQIKTLGLPRVEMTHLSMGMTQDFEVAVEEGATLVRIGTALFDGV